MKRIFFLISIFFISSCGQGKISTPNSAINKLEEFIKKEKFEPDNSLMYPGLSRPELLAVVNKNMNSAAREFQIVATNNIVNASDYHIAIKKGLKGFAGIYLQLDTEDRERVCAYFEELMDIVGLESSDGQLNNFMYGFDPNK